MNRINKNIFLIGFMGCGKSTVARELQLMCNLKVIEMDQIIEEREGLTIPEIFSLRGESYFRGCETALLRELHDSAGCVVSCGGGVAMRPENVALMKEQGLVILLTARPETILQRVRHGGERPLLEGRKNIHDISALMESRRPAYEKAADIVIETDGKSAAAIAGEILIHIER